MGQDPASMERDIEETRAELAQTIDAILDRVSPKRIAQRSIDQVIERMESRRSESVESGGRLALPARVGRRASAGRSRADDPLDRVALVGGAARRCSCWCAGRCAAGRPLLADGPMAWLSVPQSRGSIRPPGLQRAAPGGAVGRRAEEVDVGELLLIRHGETEWSRSGRHTSRTDLALTEAGEARARKLAPLLAKYQPALVLTSPMSRARRTASWRACVPTRPTLGCRSGTTATWKGARPKRFVPGIPARTIWRGPWPGGETAEQVCERLSGVLDQVRPRLAGGDVVLVAHGHSLRVLALAWLRLPIGRGSILSLDAGTLSVLGASTATRPFTCGTRRPFRLARPTPRDRVAGDGRGMTQPAAGSSPRAVPPARSRYAPSRTPPAGGVRAERALLLRVHRRVVGAACTTFRGWTACGPSP